MNKTSTSIANVNQPLGCQPAVGVVDRLAREWVEFGTGGLPGEALIVNWWETLTDAERDCFDGPSDLMTCVHMTVDRLRIIERDWTQAETDTLELGTGVAGEPGDLPLQVIT